jgi:hypothetical protein
MWSRPVRRLSGGITLPITQRIEEEIKEIENDFGVGARTRKLKSQIPLITLGNPRLSAVLDIAFCSNLFCELYSLAIKMPTTNHKSGALWLVKFDYDPPVAEICFGTRSINLHPTLNDTERMLDAIVFELCNALNYEKFQVLDISTTIDEEEYAKQNELIELSSAKQHHVVVEQMSKLPHLQHINWSKVDVYRGAASMSPERFWERQRHTEHANYYREFFRRQKQKQLLS